jgi:hypothetical protein
VIDYLALTIIIRDRAAESVGDLVSGSYHRNLEYLFERYVLFDVFDLFDASRNLWKNQLSGTIPSQLGLLTSLDLL